MKHKFYLLLLSILVTFITTQAQPTDQLQKILAGDGQLDDNFGRSVSISGDYAVVGAYGDDDETGSAYVFYKEQGGSNNWGQIAKLTASDGTPDDYFGQSVSISGDYAVVGAYGDDDETGSAYVFYKEQGGSNNWGQIAKLTASDGASDDYFGMSVSISGDNVVVGAHADDDNGTNTGSAYIFNKDQGGSNNWGQIAKLTPPAKYGEFFGFSVNILGDYAVVGARRDGGTGSAYIFNKDQGGNNNWGQMAKLTASDGAAYDNFGHSVSLSGDYVVVGAINDDDNGSDSGSAYIFNKDQGGSNNWGQMAKLTASDGAAYDYFGGSVCISGGYAVVGAYRDSYKGTWSGSAYIFQENQGGSNNWGQIAKLTAFDGGGWFGHSVSIFGDYALVGAYGNYGGTGSAYVFAPPIPTITTQPANQTDICVGNNVAFTITGDDIDNYQWQESTDGGSNFTNITNGGVYSNTTTATLNLTGVTADMNNYQYRCYVTNAYGNITSNAAILTIGDNMNPVITSNHDDQTIDADANCEAILQSYTSTVTATDNCDTDLEVTQNPVAGTTISGSINQVTLTVTDDAGNYTNTIFNVEVADNTNPSITCVINQERDADNTNTYTVSGTELNPTETDDNCGIASVLNNFNGAGTLDGAQFPEGTYTITWTITDDASNTNECSFELVVNAYVGLETLQENGISIYPNPTEGLFTMNFAKVSNFGKVRIQITDITGKIIYSYQYTIIDNQFKVDLSDFENGIYIIHIQTDKEVFTSKIIKK